MTAIGRVPNPLPGLGRILTRAMWWMEHAFERARASGKAEDDARLRIFFVLAIFFLGFCTLGVFATKAALFSGLSASASGAVATPGQRADLVDRDGRLLALDLVHYRLFVDPREVSDLAATRAALIAAAPNVPPARIDRALAGDSRVFLRGGLTPQDRQRIHDLALPGLSFEEEGGRAYPLGVTGAHVIGYASTDGRGLAGAERAFDAQIISQAGQADVPLSIDLRVQAALQDELRNAATAFTANGASGIVVNVRTGEILALASYPEFDPNNPGAASPAALKNNVANALYEPGSVMKVFTMAMALDSGVANVNTMLDARTPLALSGQTINDYDHDNAMLPLWEVFTHSSNIGSARLGMMVGPRRMEQYWRNFGLLDAAPSEFLESARPITPRAMTTNVVASMAFGHAIAVTPLALATGMSAILNGGVYRPLTLRRLQDGQAPAPGRRIITAATSRTMLNLMRLNVTNGTGGKANAPGLRVGGKTGSAEKPAGGTYARNRLVSSFAAVFPTDGALEADRYLVLIMLDEPHATAETFGFATGGWTAAPAAGRVIDRIGPLLGVRRVLLPSDSGPRAPINPALLTGGEEQ